MNYASVADDRLPSISRERFERVYNIIRNRICLLEYEPAARLGEEELARPPGAYCAAHCRYGRPCS